MPSDSVVIIGAGAAGCATAYFLTKHGLKPIVLEKDSIGSHASGFAFGGLTPFGAAGKPGADLPLLKEAMRLHIELADELKRGTGIDTSFQFLPYFSLAADEQERDELRASIPWLQSEGYPAEWLDGDALRRLEPRFAPDLVGVLRIEGAALVESYRYTLALGQAAEKGGAEIRPGEVVGLRIEGGRVTGVQTRTAIIPCDHVVVAAGPWTGPASEWLGVSIPIRPLKGQIVRLRMAGSSLDGRFTWHGSYFATKADGMIWAGTTEEEVGFDETLTDEARDGILLPLARFLPALLDAEIVQQTACLRPFSPDGLPIVDAVPGLSGLWLATGGGRRGILLSSVMGKATADLIVKGRAEVDLAPYSLGRFG